MWITRCKTNFAPDLREIQLKILLSYLRKNLLSLKADRTKKYFSDELGGVRDCDVAKVVDSEEP